jgi:hypothetical protein
MVDLDTRREGDRIIIELDPGEPVELGDLSESFAALARMYGRHYRQEGDGAPKLYVTRLETGSVIMEVAPMLVMLGGITLMDGAIIVADFTNRLWRGIKAFSAPSADIPRVDPPSAEDARDIKEFAKPLLGKNGASLGIKHARYESVTGEKRTVVEYHFDEAELNRAAINIQKSEEHLIEVESSLTTQRRYTQVMLFFDQANRSPGKEKGRTGDRAIVPAIHDKPLPVWFLSGFQDLKDRMIRDAHPLRSTFIVDLFVQVVEGSPKGYVVTDVIRVIPDEEN